MLLISTLAVRITPPFLRKLQVSSGENLFCLPVSFLFSYQASRALCEFSSIIPRRSICENDFFFAISSCISRRVLLLKALQSISICSKFTWLRFRPNVALPHKAEVIAQMLDISSAGPHTQSGVKQCIPSHRI